MATRRGRTTTAGTARPADEGETARSLSDLEGLDEAYARHGADCYAIARRILRDERLAEDVVQEVFLAMWRDPGRYEPARGGLGAFLVTISRHKAVDHVRRLRSRPVCDGNPAVLDLIAADTPSPEHRAVLGERAARVVAALDALPPTQRDCLVLAYYEGYSQTEIAAKRGIPLGTVKTRCAAGMRRLAASLADLGPFASDDSGPT